LLRIKRPFKTCIEKGIKRSDIKIEADHIISMKTFPGQEITFKNGYE